MHDNLLEVLESYTLKNRLRRVWKKFVQIMACFVVFCTTYALILPAITQESDIYCGLTEHTHTDTCYVEAGRILACSVTGDVAHSHNDDCRDENGTLICTLAEQEQHIHTDGCYDSEDAAVLICTDPLAVVHVHGDECFAEAQAAHNCGLEEHTHTLICHSDSQADLETQEIWEQSIAFAELTGVWSEDVVSIARTQRGYVESTRNYIVLENETVKGYTRYGAWYGDPYGDWAAMFASFCLNYAGVEDMPLESDVRCWIEVLTAADLYRSQGSYVPAAGELIFFDMDSDGAADHVGIITELITGEDGTVPQISIIEGDSTNRVQELCYSLDDARIVGCGQLPVQLSAAELKDVNLVIAKIEALPAAAETDEAYNQQVAEAYHLYSGLNDAQKKKVTNADKLMALESIWSVTEYIVNNTFDSDPVTITQSAHTSELVELNIFDYSGQHSPEDTKVISDRLGADGYPYLVQTAPDKEADNTSLSCLFDERHEAGFADKMNTDSADGLFRQDPVSGEYFYNSRWNHAQYDETASAFTLYDQIVTPNFIDCPFGNFLPFHNITNEQNATQVQAFNYQGGVRDYILAALKNLEDCNTASEGKDLTVIELIEMLESYQASWEADGMWDSLTAADAMKDFLTDADLAEQTQLLGELYNINYDVEKNFFFGMEMKMTFMQPRDGLTGRDNGNNETGTWEKGCDKNGDTLTEDDDTLILTGEKDGKADYPMFFSFTGDDDVWVYVDGIRFLDLSGIHHHVGGKIDFEKGVVYYYQSDSAAKGDLKDDAYETQSFRDILTQYGGIAEEDLGNYLKQDESGNFTTFHDYSAHTLNFYYLERGSGSSVYDLRFNLPLIQKNSITVSNEVSSLTGGELTDTVLGNPDYYFNLITGDHELFVGPGSVTGVTEYKIRGMDSNLLKNADGTDKVFTTDSHGIFTLKAGQTAVFEEIGENQGEFFAQELIRAEDNGQYPAVYVNDQKTLGNDLIDWSSRKYFCTDETADVVHAGPYDSQWYGWNGSMVQAASAFVFNYNNRVDTAKLGSLAITAELIGTATDRTFDMELTLDGEKIPAGTVYTVGGEERTVAESGIVTIGSGETAVISNILSGTKYELRQTDTDGYTVSYASVGSRSRPATQNDSVTGMIRAEQNVGIFVTNAENGAAVQIPVTGTLANSDGKAHNYTFLLEQVTDSTGETLMQDGTVMEQTVELTAEPASFYFNLPYLAAEMEPLPATFFYRITEKGEEADCLDNTQQFVAEVLVEATADGIQATLTGINGSSDLRTADFLNTLAGSLTLRNTLNGDDAHKAHAFEFVIELTAHENVALPAELHAIRTAADGTQTILTLKPENGVIRIEALADGETVAITGIPAGTGWSISQSYAYEFITTIQVGETTNEGRAAAGTITAGDTAVDYINTQTYALPKTGGTGTSQYTMAGWMLLLCSAAYLMYNLAKRRKGGSVHP